MKEINEILHITEDASVLPTKWILSWKRPDFQVDSKYESEEISKEDAFIIMDSIKLCNHQWEVTLTDKKQFNYCTKCEKCTVLLRD